MERIETGIKAFDEILQGGFPEGASVLIVGAPGSGKTIFAHQMAFHNANNDNKVVYLTTLSEPQVKVMKFQQEFDYFDYGKFQKSLLYRDLGSVLRKRGAAQTLIMIDEILQKHQPRLIVIDTIKTLSDMIPSIIAFREFLLDLSLRIATWGCTALFLGEYPEEEIQLRPESAIADGIIYLYGTEERKQQKRFLRVLKMRGTGFPGGQNIFKITQKGIELYPRLNPEVNNNLYQSYSTRLSSGLAELDAMMEGGIPQGTTTLISGASGTGKTLLATYYTYQRLKEGNSVVFVTFEENCQMFIQGAKQFGLDLEGFIKSGELRLMHVSPMELDVDEHIYWIQEQAKESGASLLVIDSISAFEVGISDKVKYTDYIWALCEYFKTVGVSTLLVHEMHDALHITGLTKHGISYIADNIIALQYVEQGFSIKRYLRIVKMRSSSHSTDLRKMEITPKGLALGECLT